jgi:Arylsulfotransferase (ASST)
MVEDASNGPAQEEEPEGSFLDRWLHTAFLAGVAALFFLAGTIFTIKGIFPGPQISRALEGGRALYSKLTEYDDVYKSDLWLHERRKEKGLTVNWPDRMQDGFTLYTSGSEAAAHLVDPEGSAVHSWRRPYSTVWKPGAGGPAKPQPDSHVYFRQAHVFANGDLLALYEGVGDTPYGYGIVKLDRKSALIWIYTGRAHHQFSVAPDGKIYALTHELVDDQVQGHDHLKRPRLEDSLVVLSPDGEELNKIRLVTAVADSPYRHMLYTVSGFSLADPLHANSVKFITAQDAANFAFGDEGDVLLSFRELHAVAVINPHTGKVRWATRGPWLGQHDPDILPNGNILLFDNYGNYDSPEDVSRVIEFNPATMEIVWRYAGTAESPLRSLIRSDQQRLANGNTLITESNGGRIVEVTRDGEIAWEFVNPVRGGPDGNLIPIIAWAERLDRSTIQLQVLRQGEEMVEEARIEKPVGR